MSTNTTNTTRDSDAFQFHIPSQLGNLSIGMLLNDLNMTHLNNAIANGMSGHSELNMSEIIENITMSLESPENTSHRTIHRDPMAIVIPVTICYAIIFVAGILGNVITCAVIFRNKSMHTATNYYLFNLAVSDLLLLLSGKHILSQPPLRPHTHTIDRLLYLLIYGNKTYMGII